MDNPRSYVSALRAVASVYLLQTLKPVGFIILILTIIAYSSIVYLAVSFSPWWWLLLFVAIPVTIIVCTVAALCLLITKRLLPRKLDVLERRTLLEFTNKLGDISEKAQTPYPVIVFLIAKDVMLGHESAFIRDTIGNSKSLSGDFRAIKNMFDK